MVDAVLKLLFCDKMMCNISGTDSECNGGSGVSNSVPYFWTAGQRRDPSRVSPFVWRVTPYSQDVYPMNYTQWLSEEPTDLRMACVSMMVVKGKGYKYNVESCSRPLCSVCEIDMK